MTIDVEKFYIDVSDRAIYDRLERELPIKKISKKDLFMFALVTGYQSKLKIPVNKRLEFFWANNLKPEDEIVIRSIVLDEEKNVGILQNTEQLVGIAQDYAHGGVSILKEKLDQYGSYIKYIEMELDERYQEQGWK